MHLIGQEINHQASILGIITKNQIQQSSKKRLSRSNLSKIEIEFREFVHLDMACSV